jgi:hypothetical protein
MPWRSSEGDRPRWFPFGAAARPRRRTPRTSPDRTSKGGYPSRSSQPTTLAAASSGMQAVSPSMGRSWQSARIGAFRIGSCWFGTYLGPYPHRQTFLGPQSPRTPETRGLPGRPRKSRCFSPMLEGDIGIATLSGASERFGRRSGRGKSSSLHLLRPGPPSGRTSPPRASGNGCAGTDDFTPPIPAVSPRIGERMGNWGSTRGGVDRLGG